MQHIRKCFGCEPRTNTTEVIVDIHQITVVHIRPALRIAYSNATPPTDNPIRELLDIQSFFILNYAQYNMKIDPKSYTYNRTIIYSKFVVEKSHKYSKYDGDDADTN
jgi:hypothetical protein